MSGKPTSALPPSGPERLLDGERELYVRVIELAMLDATALSVKAMGEFSDAFPTEHDRASARRFIFQELLPGEPASAGLRWWVESLYDDAEAAVQAIRRRVLLALQQSHAIERFVENRGQREAEARGVARRLKARASVSRARVQSYASS